VAGKLLQQQAALFGDARVARAFQRRVHQASAGMPEAADRFDALAGIGFAVSRKVFIDETLDRG
jgi:hypothetical protein